MHRPKLINIFIFIFFASAFFPAFSNTLEIVTTDFPPYQISHNEKLDGMATEIISESLASIHKTSHTSVYPWGRAYQLALATPVLIYSIARTKEREHLFKWIAPIIPFKVYMWKLKDRKDIQAKTIDDAKKYIVGGVFDDVKATYLSKEGFVANKNLELVRNDELNIRKLYQSHIDLMPFDEVSFPYKISNSSLNPSKVEKLFKLKSISGELYLAANKNISDLEVNEIKAAIIAFKKTERYKAIKFKYSK